MEGQPAEAGGKPPGVFGQQKPAADVPSPLPSAAKAWPKARDYLLLQRRELSGTKECDKGRRERAGMEPSLPAPLNSLQNKEFRALS